jgi:NADPH:quinone reductase-like Zn-dependent oxidoreductase
VTYNIIDNQNKEMMKSVLIRGPGHVEFGEIEKPKPQAGQVLVKLDCAVINPSDLYFMAGSAIAKKPDIKYPLTPGWEGAGTIVEVGDLVSSGLVGKRVGCLKHAEQGGKYHIGGMYAEYALTTVTGIVPLSDDTSFEQGCALFVNPLTALCMIHRIKALESKCVIITAAASQLGRQLTRLCNKEGITPICTVRRQE